MSVLPPEGVRKAGFLVAGEGAVGLAVALVLVLRGLAGTDQGVVSGYGTAIWFLVVGGAVLAAGLALARGRIWGRGIAVIAQLLLLPVAWYVAVGSHQWVYGIPIGLAALAVLGLLFSPAAVRWTGSGGHPDAASPTNSGPDSR